MGYDFPSFVKNAFLLDLGRMTYGLAHELQQSCVAWRLKNNEQTDLFLVVEHFPVFTLGKRGGKQSLLVSEEFLRAQGVELVVTERGGDITYHGPGQLVIYPIISLRQRRLSVAGYVDLLEDLMIDLAASFGVSAGRDTRNRGVWVGDNKIGSIGIRVRHGVSFHGMAFNVSLEFEHFSWINPCGLQQVGVTSLVRELKETVSFMAVKAQAIALLEEKFMCRLEPGAVSTFVENR